MMYVQSKRAAKEGAGDAVSQPFALRLSEVCKSFGDTQAVAEVSLKLGYGDILCLLGPSGCGKTTLLRLIAGFDTPDAGTVHIGGRTAYDAGVNESPERRRVGMVFQEGALFPHLTVAQNIAFGLRRGRQRKEQAAAALRMVALEGYGSRYPHQLSGGQQQRVALARALAPAPEVVLMDEPFSSLDAGLRTQLRADMRAILKERRATAVCVTHDQEEAMQLGDTVAVMQAGRIVQAGSPEEAFHQPDNRFAAEFFGAADFLPAWQDGDRLASEVGRMPWPERWPSPWPAGRELQVMARPDCLDIVADAAGTGVVIGREFLGAFYLYLVELPSGRRVRSLQSHVVSLEPGTRVRISVRAGHNLLPFVDGKAFAGDAALFSGQATGS